MSKYLLLKLGAFGDLSFFLPVLDQIHAQDPEAEITWIVGDAYAEILKQIPTIRRVIAVNETALYDRGGWSRILETLKLWSRLELRYDQIWIGHRTLSALFLVRLRVFGNLFQVVRSPSKYLNWLRHEVIVPPLSLHESHVFKLLAEKALNTKIPLELWKADYSWVPPLTSESTFKNKINGLFNETLSDPMGGNLTENFIKTKFIKKFIVVHLGGGQNGKTEFLLKQWPHWSKFLNQLAAQTTLPIILVGAPSEQALADEIIESLDLGDLRDSKERLVSLVGQTTYLELLAVIRSAHRFIGVDSGPLHFADSLGVQSIGLYGPTSTVSWGLLGQNSRTIREPVSCSPCYRDTGEFPSCPFDAKCMTGLGPEKVLSEFRAVEG